MWDNARVEPQDPVKRLEYLERLIAGLEQTRESLRFEIPYYTDEDLQGRYAKKFLVAVEAQIEETQKRLDELRKTLPPAPRPEGE